MKHYATPADYGGWYKCPQFCVPTGIGDLSWIWSKVRHLRDVLDIEKILFYIPSDSGSRCQDLIELLPGAAYGGPLEDRTNDEVIQHATPAEWPLYYGYKPLHRAWPVNLAANFHLEQGKPLAQWLPILPTDYHYPIDIPAEQQKRAAAILSGLPRPIIVLYISNRDKDQIKQGGWNLWSLDEWSTVVESITYTAPGCKDATFLILGAEYDRDKSKALEFYLTRAGKSVKTIIGEPLGVALAALSQCNMFLGYPSGIGVMANVLSVPGAMLLPWLLRGLETSWVDPMDQALNYFRCFVDPTPGEVVEWFVRKGVVMAQTLPERRWVHG